MEKGEPRSKIKLGKIGEKLASNYLEKNNYKIIEKNHRSRFGEIDIIAKVDDIFVFVEVKTKSTRAYGEPEEMVNFKKKQKLIRLAKSYMQDKEISDKPFRIDVISVILKDEPKIKHFKNAIEEN